MKVSIHPDSWVCVCGSNRGFNGFVPCSVEGIPIPFRCRACMSKPKYYRCRQCGRVVDAATLDVVKSTMVFGFHWLGRRWIPDWSLRTTYGCNHA